MPIDRPSAEALALEACLAYLKRRYGPGYFLDQVTINLHGPDGIKSVAQILPPAAIHLADAEQTGRQQDRQPGNDIRAQIETILSASQIPLKGRAIARKVNRQYSSYFREILADMRANGKVIISGGGYWLSGRPVPTDGHDSEPGN